MKGATDMGSSLAARAAQLHQQGLKVREIAAKLKRSRWNIYYMLKRAGIRLYKKDRAGLVDEQPDAERKSVPMLVDAIRLLEERVEALYDEAHRIEAVLDTLRPLVRKA
jgi:transcriptional regulator